VVTNIRTRTEDWNKRRSYPESSQRWKWKQDDDWTTKPQSKRSCSSNQEVLKDPQIRAAVFVLIILRICPPSNSEQHTELAESLSNISFKKIKHKPAELCWRTWNELISDESFIFGLNHMSAVSATEEQSRNEWLPAKPSSLNSDRPSLEGCVPSWGWFIVTPKKRFDPTLCLYVVLNLI